MPRVVVVGAGPCGLAALKEMLEKGHDATLLEKTEHLGGVFASAVAYPDLHLTISNWVMNFSDFPDPTRQCYPTAVHYLEYLKAYAKHFGLEKHIEFGTEITSATLGGDGKWSVEVNQTNGRGSKNMRCDALVVATGAHSVPKQLPTALWGYQGRVMHSCEYDDAFKRAVKQKQLRVLVVGGGESGADITAELSDLSSNVSVWLRRTVCIGPRYLNSKNEMQQVAENKQRDFPANGFLEAATTNRMSAAQNVFFYGMWRRILWRLPILNGTLGRLCLQSTSTAWIMNDQATYVTKNQRMCEAIHTGRLETLICPDVSAKDRTVEFRMPDGKAVTREFDVIVHCTGYTAQFPWLKVKMFDSNPRSWFLHCFPEKLGHCLSFVGYARPHQGGIPPMAEMQARYVAMLLSGERKLPSNYAKQARQQRDAEREYYHTTPYLHTLVDYSAYIESVARRVGCEPRMPLWSVVLVNLHLMAVALLVLSLFQADFNFLGFQGALALWAGTIAAALLIDDALLVKWWFYPGWDVWYRQRGPGAKPEVLQNTLRRVPFWKSTAVTKGFVLLVFWSFPTYYLQRFLSPLVFCMHTVAQMLHIRWPKRWGGFLMPKMFALHGTEWRLSDLFAP